MVLHVRLSSGTSNVSLTTLQIRFFTSIRVSSLDGAREIHPSKHYEIRLSLSQLCGVNKAPPQLLGSGQCAPNSFGVESPPGRRHRIETWLHRCAAMMPPTSSQRRPAVVSRWLRLEKLRIRCDRCRVRETTISVCERPRSSHGSPHQCPLRELVDFYRAKDEPNADSLRASLLAFCRWRQTFAFFAVRTRRVFFCKACQTFMNNILKEWPVLGAAGTLMGKQAVFRVYFPSLAVGQLVRMSLPPCVALPSSIATLCSVLLR